MQHGRKGTPAAEERTLLSRQGTAYRVEGDGLETIVLVHGVGSAMGTWWRLSGYLDHRYRLVSYDLRGHGRSAKKTPPWSIQDFVSDHVQLMEEIGVGRYHLVGFSLGALIAVGVTIKTPDAVDRLVLLNCAGDRQEEDRARVAGRVARVRASSPASLARESTTRWFTGDFLASHPEEVEKEVAIVSATDGEMYKAAYEVLATTDPVDEVSQVTRPVLLVTGEHDTGSTPRMSKSLAARLPGSTVQVVPGLKHYLHVEVPETVAGHVESFLSLAEGGQPISQKTP